MEQSLFTRKNSFRAQASFSELAQAFIVIMNYEEFYAISLTGSILKKWSTTDFYYASELKTRGRFFCFLMNDSRALKIVEVCSSPGSKNYTFNSYFVKSCQNIIDFDFDQETGSIQILTDKGKAYEEYLGDAVQDTRSSSRSSYNTSMYLKLKLSKPISGGLDLGNISFQKKEGETFGFSVDMQTSSISFINFEGFNPSSVKIRTCIIEGLSQYDVLGSTRNKLILRRETMFYIIEASASEDWKVIQGMDLERKTLYTKMDPQFGLILFTQEEIAGIACY